MNITNLINYFTSADNSKGKDVSKIDSFLEYNMLGQFLNGNISASDGEKYYRISDIKSKEQDQLKALYNNVAEKYNSLFESKDIEITDDNAQQYSKLLTNFEMVDKQSSSADSDNMKKIRQALYQYILDSQYELDDDLGIDNINYEFVINQIINDKHKIKEKNDLEIDITDSKAAKQEEKFKPSDNLSMKEVDVDTLMNAPQDGMYAINSRGIKIIYENKYYYSPDYPDIPAERNIYGLNFYLNQEFAYKIEKDLSEVLNSKKTDAEKKEYVADFINKFKNWSYNANKNFLYQNGIRPGTKEYASISDFKIPFVVGDDYTPQFDIDSIYKFLLEKYTNSQSN